MRVWASGAFSDVQGARLGEPPGQSLDRVSASIQVPARFVDAGCVGLDGLLALLDTYCAWVDDIELELGRTPARDDEARRSQSPESRAALPRRTGVSAGLTIHIYAEQ